MKTALLSIALAMAGFSVANAGSVNGYYRSNGTYVQPSYRSNPDSTVTNNYSFKGNSDPYSGSTGSDRYTHDLTSPYFNGTPNSNGRYGHSNGW
jgi:hypothetical protein